MCTRNTLMISNTTRNGQYISSICNHGAEPMSEAFGINQSNYTYHTDGVCASIPLEPQ